MDEAERILGRFARDPEMLAWARQVLRPPSAVRRARPTGVRPSQPIAVEREYERVTLSVARAAGEALGNVVLMWSRREGSPGELRGELAGLRERLARATAVDQQIANIAARVIAWNAADMTAVLGVPVSTRFSLTDWRARQGDLVRSVALQQIDRVEAAALALVTDGLDLVDDERRAPPRRGDLSPQARRAPTRSTRVQAPARLPPGTPGVERARRIRGATEQQAQRVAAAVEGAVERGTRHEDMVTLLRDELGISERRAALIARDQVLAANAELTRQQHRDAGVEAYEWSTAGDDRVRPEHERANGQVFRWDGPGAPGAGVKGAHAHPGEAILCRCVALPHFG